MFGRRAHKGSLRRPGKLRRVVRLAAFTMVVTLALMLVLAFQFFSTFYNLNEGDVSAYNIKSPARVTYMSQIKTQEERIRASGTVADVYTLDPDVAEESRQLAADVLRTIGEIRRSASPLEMKRDRINQLPNAVLPASVVDDILAFDEPAWRAVEADAMRLVDRLMRERIAERQLDEVKGGLMAQVDAGLSERQATAVNYLVRNFIQPNFIVDTEATDLARQEAQDRVQPVLVTVERGETILRDGSIVRDLDIEKLDAVGLRSPALSWNSMLASFTLAALMVLILALYIYSFQPLVADDMRRLLLLGLVILIASLAARLTITGRDVNTYYGYLFPMAAASMLVAILLDPGLGFIVTLMLAMIMGLVSGFSFDLAVLGLIGGSIGLLAVHRLERFTTIFRAGLYVSLANLAVVTSFHLQEGIIDPQRMGILAFTSGVNGMLSALLAFSALYLFGHVFGITTAMSMLELAHPSQPLFRRLLTEAPGTYHHSVVVANLAERAAEIIQADTLLCRIGAYYHDIGKIVRPYAFIENQVDGQNIHEELDAYTSAQLIIAHPSDGLDLARRHGVPQRVCDLIAEHHGTGIVKYFYQQACQNATQPVDEAPFRYEGPRPQTRESGIMMLADSVEAAVRASRDHSTEAIAAIVGRIMQERLSDGQLDRCDLTLRDLDDIKQIFTEVLQGIFHPRIEYPVEPASLISGENRPFGRRRTESVSE